METGKKAVLETIVTEEEGHAIATVVAPCVHSDAIVKQSDLPSVEPEYIEPAPNPDKRRSNAKSR